ncbi:MAG: hypothetical protein K0R61_4729 [Microvirga sp.]|nr:hypothetical protein [Microvirga sp.]
MLLPVTFSLAPVPALIMLAGIFYGAQYGGSTTAILVNLPGEPSSVVTALDGYQMARQGKAGRALATAAIASFVAGTIATVIIAVFAPPLALFALKFGPAEYFSLMVLGLVASIILAHGSLLHALGMILLGLLLGLVGTDINSGMARFTFDFPELGDGIGFVTLAMGVFGIGDIVANLEHEATRIADQKSVTGLMPSRDDWRRIAGPIIRGTILGSALGILPGGGALLASFGAYSFEKKVSRHSAEFGRGAIEGVAAPEAANNAGAQTSFIPMLTLGIPANPVMAHPVIVVFCCIGVFSLNNNTFDVFLMAAFGVLGYTFRKLGAEPAPMLLAFVLGPLMEEFLRRALLLSRGSPSILVTSPISGAMLALAAVSLMLVLLPGLRRTRKVAFQEEM